ncbi:MAG: endolytic transglycosylase MltG, partial [Acidobacteriota bacterium]
MKRFVGLMFVLLALAAAGLGAWTYRGLNKQYKGYTEPEQYVEIPAGSGTATIGRRLADAGVVRDANTFRLALWLTGEGRRLQAGEYRFDRPMTVKEVIAKIARGDVFLRPITFREGLTIRQMAELYESKGFGAAAEFVAAARNPEPIRDLDPHAQDLEGYLFPDTYTLPRHSTAAQLIARMVAGFQKTLTPELRAEAAARGLSVHELVTLASIVEKETGKAEERPLVAAVYANRLKIGMGLQCDPTVIFALERAGRYAGNLTHENMQYDSPYNTYRYAGLPPGPIAAPGKAALDAAANPADVPHLYFVSRGDGSHAFASTLDEHNHNVFEFQKRGK